MKDIKHLWKLAPTVLRSLLIAVLVIAVAGFSTAAVGVGTQSLPAIPSSASPPPQPDSRLIARALSGAYTIPTACSVPIIPAIVTEEEVELRQYQADFAQFIEEQAELDSEVNLTSQRDVLAIRKFRLDCQIMLTRAQQALQSNNIDPTFDIAITPQEVELRQRQFELAKQIDSDAVVAQEAGVASLNRLWSARRARIDADILLTQAKVQQRLQARQRDSD
ncbi:MAG: hypothetical protein AAFZ35_18310 [Cyanobacteria bacterium J06649_12]